MSVEKNRHEALRWLKTAQDDLATANILKENQRFAHACFHAQQAGEKAIKAVWYYVGADPWGHSLQKLIQEFESVDLELKNKLAGLLRDGMILDRFYIPTRYPNGLPDITPDVAYIEEDAHKAIGHAAHILEAAKTILEA